VRALELVYLNGDVGLNSEFMRDSNSNLYPIKSGIRLLIELSVPAQRNLAGPVASGNLRPPILLHWIRLKSRMVSKFTCPSQLLVLGDFGPYLPNGVFDSTLRDKSLFESNVRTKL
jgi:hypothetical protein